MTLTETTPADPATVRDLRALPKGHLHLHMEAAMRPATLVAMSDALGIEPPPVDTFRGFTAFIESYRGLLAALDHPDHLGILMDQIFADQAAQGVAYLELGVSPHFYAERYGSYDAALAEMLDLARSASATHGVAFGFMPTIDRMAGLEPALEVARSAARFAGEGVVSLGLAADERGFPCADFAEPFAIGRAAGLQSTPHAGELVGPESVREALDALGADRILHGVRAVEAPALVAELAERGIPLDVCPTSNVLLDVVAEIGEHPLTYLLEQGVRCSINADDPILFGPDILAEYELCRTSLGLSDEQLAACAWTSIETTLAPADVKAAAKAGIDR
ncbi:adenosine deaminase [Microbacterium sp. LRZ72]|uniref:adenosine deaminase n=1 Tax=Microbacterium sp. LRZ72 TaxID=2942481 RepID=UPI0029A0FD6A|nr:adenosine deaminase [Microbacterium sp. LRZ72]MDX2377688.1 adenosine deaminase [Microbacterium sp. LRZ72]